MLIFQESGRLGNQIFQYAALKTLCKDEKILLLGFEDLQSTFENINAKIVNLHSPKIEQRFYRRIYILYNFLSRRNIISRITESRSTIRKPEVIYNTGLLNHLIFTEQSFFQYETSFNPIYVETLAIKDDLISFSQDFINSFAHSNKCFFIHIRRGDYLKWPDSIKPAVLPVNYYRKCIKIIQENIDNPFFIFMSDDPFYVEDIFGSMNNSIISKFSSFEDFAIMTQCQGGILSASSFSWWGAYFLNLKHPDSILLSPKYWAGHRIQSWYPPFIESTFLKYIDV